MESKETKYDLVVGLEMHVQLKTNSKAFCGDNTSFGAAPNTQVSPISLGHPGTLPKINKVHVESAIKLGLALGCRINKENRFDRKNYFYADLPKGYQITQDALPICVGGSLPLYGNGLDHHIRINRIHMEEDAGKSIHDQNPEFSLIDLNRAGVPLLEVVTEPDIRSADEACRVLAEMRKLVRYLAISDGNMEEGSLRCDCNISLKPKGQKELGTRCEIKNINSIRNVKRAVEYEANRQKKILEEGGSIDQETRSFNATTGDTLTVLRSKEDAQDYRYFPDPDLPGLILKDADLEKAKASLPALPWDCFRDFISTYNLGENDALTISEDLDLAKYYMDLAAQSGDSRTSANWVINTIKAYLNTHSISITDFPLSVSKIARLMSLVKEQLVSKVAATQQLFPEMLLNTEADPAELADKLDITQKSDLADLEKLIDQALEKYPEKVIEYRRGKKGILGLFMGEVMKLSGGSANPQITRKILQDKLKG